MLIVHSEKDEEHDAIEIYSHEFIKALDATYSFTASKNAEVMLRWQTLCLHSECEFILPHVVDFITGQGRMKFVRPLYRTLRSSEIGKKLAVETFEAKKDM